MNKNWSDEAWDDYLYWQSKDKKTLKKINDLLKDIERNGENVGIGHPEPLKGNLSGSGADASMRRTGLFTELNPVPS
jgi:toxin YoeB